MRQKQDLAQRQARVGIVANPAKVKMPVGAPPDTFLRWPDLRSRRRLRKQGLAPPAEIDPVLDGVALAALARDLRSQTRHPAFLSGCLRRLRALLWT